MAVINSLTLGSRKIDLEAFTGDVVDSKMTEYTSSSQYTRQDGSTGHQYSTTYKNWFRVARPGGKQWELEVPRHVMTATTGDQVTLFWGVDGGKETNWLAVYNHATERLGYLTLDVARLAGPPFYWVMLFTCGVVQFFALAGMVQGYFTAWVAFLLASAPWVVVFKRRGAIRQAIRDAIPRLGQAQPISPVTPNAPPPPASDREIRI